MADMVLDNIVLQSPNGQYRMQISLTDSAALEVRLLLPDGKGLETRSAGLQALGLMPDGPSGLLFTIA
jgi:hypothetical protein